MLFTVRQGALL